MTKTRKLKLPDGGSFDLAIPAGFGEAPVLAESVPLSRNVWILVAAAGATIAVVALVKVLGSR